MMVSEMCFCGHPVKGHINNAEKCTCPNCTCTRLVRKVTTENLQPGPVILNSKCSKCGHIAAEHAQFETGNADTNCLVGGCRCKSYILPSSLEAMRFNAGKARWDLLPSGPLSALVNVYTYGAHKYADENWRNGLSFKQTFASMMRHAWAWFSGETSDAESGCHHLAHVAWNCLTLIEFDMLLDGLPQEDPKQKMDDRERSGAPIEKVHIINNPNRS